jgi:abhydrolase domain-containing protein 8
MNATTDFARNVPAPDAIAQTIVVRGEPIEIRPGRVLDIAITAPPVTPAGTHGDLPVVFLAHGGGGNKNQWRYQWQAFAAAGHKVVAWDFLGHGASPRPSPSGLRGEHAYDGHETLHDYLAIFDRYAGKRNVLVGHSMGSGATLALLEDLAAAGRLNEVSGVGLLGTRAHKPVPGAVLQLPAFLLELFKPFFARRFERAAWHAKADPALIAYENAFARNNTMAVMQAVLRGGRWGDVTRLAALPLPPIVVIAGDTDGLTPAQDGRALSDALPSAYFHVLAQCGHQIMLEKPAQVNGLLLDLLQTVKEQEHVRDT